MKLVLLSPSSPICFSARAFGRVFGDRVLFSTSKAELPEGWLQIHPRSSTRSIREDLPGHVQVLLDCSAEESVTANLSRSVPLECRQYTQKSLWQHAHKALNMEEWLSTAVEFTQPTLAEISEAQALLPVSTLFRIADLPGADHKIIDSNTIIDWDTNDSLAITFDWSYGCHSLSVGSGERRTYNCAYEQKSQA